MIELILELQKTMKKPIATARKICAVDGQCRGSKCPIWNSNDACVILKIEHINDEIRDILKWRMPKQNTKETSDHEHQSNQD